MKKPFLLSILTLFSLVTKAQNVLPSYVPPNGLVGWWPLDSNANDMSVNHNDGIAANVIYTTDRMGRQAKAAGFNGLNSVIDIVEKPSQRVRKITMSAWVYTTETRYSQIMYKAQYNAANENYSLSNVALFLKNNRAWYWAYSTTPIPTGTWVHLCSTSDGTYIRNYRNGSFINQEPFGGLIDTFASNLRIGYSHNNGGYNSGIAGDSWDGALDDIGLWNRALNEEEIFRLYQESIVVPPPPPPAGIAASAPQSNILIWPNPTDENIKIEGTMLAGSTVCITNAMGQLVWNTKATSSFLKIDKTQLGTSGLYFIRITNPKGELIQTEKLTLL